MKFLFFSGLAAFFELLFVLFPIVICLINKKIQCLKLLLILFVILWWDNTTLIFLSNYFGSSFGLHWNWFGKGFEAIWPLVVVYWFKWLSPTEVGYQLPKGYLIWVWVICLTMLFTLIFLSIDLIFGGGSRRLSILETILFQSTMPGLAEEQVYRGIILALFNRIFLRNWKLLNVSFGWGLILTTLLFVAAHVVTYSVTSGIVWNFSSFIPVFILGFLFGWLKEKSGSLWPSIILHNSLNTFYQLGRWLIAT